MRALVYEGPHRLSVKEVADPEPKAGEVLLEVEFAGICGSDVHGYTGETGRRSPGAIMGHEASGRVVGLGDGVRAELLGRHVTFNPVQGCGRCVDCATGRTNRCAGSRVVGVDPGLPGAFAEHLAVRADSVVEISAGAGPRGALAEPLAVGLHAVAAAGNLRDRDMLVVGCGMIGLACVWAALARDVRTVYAADIDSRRTRAAERLGAVVVDGDIRVDAAIDAVGVSATLERALASVGRGGRVVLVGMGSPVLELGAYSVTAAERSLIGSFCYAEDEFVEAVSIVERDAAFDGLVEREVGLDEASSAFAELAGGATAGIKTVVRPTI